jgi:Fe-S-cluster-containing hydrogenase component 2
MAKGRIEINEVNCKGCTLCMIACPQNVIAMVNDYVNAKGYPQNWSSIAMPVALFAQLPVPTFVLLFTDRFHRGPAAQRQRLKVEEQINLWNF